MDSPHIITVVFGKAEEMDKCLFSLEHYADVNFKKIVFINTSPEMNGQENVEVFLKHRRPGDRAFLCDSNYWTSPYRYALFRLIPEGEKFSLYTESDVWIEKKCSFFSRGLQRLSNAPDVGLISMLTRYYTPDLAQKIPSFKGYREIPTRWVGAQFLWHFVLLDNALLKKYFRSKHGRELTDSKIARYFGQSRRLLIEDGRDLCCHFDSVATANKYPLYQNYYKTSTPDDRQYTRECFSCKYRDFNGAHFKEIE